MKDTETTPRLTHSFFEIYASLACELAARIREMDRERSKAKSDMCEGKPVFDRVEDAFHYQELVQGIMGLEQEKKELARTMIEAGMPVNAWVKFKREGDPDVMIRVNSSGASHTLVVKPLDKSLEKGKGG